MIPVAGSGRKSKPGFGDCRYANTRTPDSRQPEVPVQQLLNPELLLSIAWTIHDHVVKNCRSTLKKKAKRTRLVLAAPSQKRTVTVLGIRYWLRAQGRGRSKGEDNLRTATTSSTLPAPPLAESALHWDHDGMGFEQSIKTTSSARTSH